MTKLLFAFYLTLVFFFLLFINFYYLEGIPHVPDSAAYLFMAKMFATGHIIMPIPVSPEHFNFFPGILSIDNGKWLFQYPFGHPLLLAIGIFIGIPNIIPPLVGTLFVLILYLIAKEVFDRKTALFALILPILSPFFLENASSFMSHNTAAFYLVLSLYFSIRFYKSKNVWHALLSGLFVGLLFNTRPLTALPFILLNSSILFFYKNSRQMHSFVLFLTGLFPLLFLWLIYNYISTGNPLASQYYLQNRGMLPFENPTLFLASLQKHIENVKILLQSFGPMAFNWPKLITYGFLFIPFALRRNTFWDHIFFIGLLTLPLTYFFYDGTFIMYGPRFWYEILPFVILLSARSLALIYELIPKITIFFFVVLIFLSFAKLFGFIPTTNPDYFSPLKLNDLKGFNFVDKRIINEIKTRQIHNAVVFVKDCDNNWWCYGSVFSQNSPTLDTDIVYAKDLGNPYSIALMDFFEGRSFYRIDYYTLDLKEIYY